MSTYEVVLSGETSPHVIDADAYQQEGPMTTFFACESNHVRLDSWALRLASFRSADVRMIRRVSLEEPGARPALGLVLEPEEATQELCG